MWMCLVIQFFLGKSTIDKKKNYVDGFELDGRNEKVPFKVVSEKYLIDKILRSEKSESKY